jgi:hypothetical protein
MADSIRGFVTLALVLCSLSACGGGGGGSDPVVQPPPPADTSLDWDEDNWDEKDWT